MEPTYKRPGYPDEVFQTPHTLERNDPENKSLLQVIVEEKPVGQVREGRDGQGVPIFRGNEYPEYSTVECAAREVVARWEMEVSPTHRVSISELIDRYRPRLQYVSTTLASDLLAVSNYAGRIKVGIVDDTVTDRQADEIVRRILDYDDYLLWRMNESLRLSAEVPLEDQLDGEIVRVMEKLRTDIKAHLADVPDAYVEDAEFDALLDLSEYGFFQICHEVQVEVWDHWIPGDEKTWQWIFPDNYDIIRAHYEETIAEVYENVKNRFEERARARATAERKREAIKARKQAEVEATRKEIEERRAREATEAAETAEQKAREESQAAQEAAEAEKAAQAEREAEQAENEARAAQEADETEQTDTDQTEDPPESEESVIDPADELGHKKEEILQHLRGKAVPEKRNIIKMAVEDPQWSENYAEAGRALAEEHRDELGDPTHYLN